MKPYHTLLVVLVQMGTWVMVSNVDPNVLHVTEPKKFVLNQRIAKLSVILLVKMEENVGVMENVSVRMDTKDQLVGNYQGKTKC